MYNENSRTQCKDGKGRVDGLHRCTVSRELGVTRIYALFTRRAKYPLVPLPTEWKQVRVYDYGQFFENEGAKRPAFSVRGLIFPMR